MLAWVFRRCDGEAEADETPIGYVPEPEHLELDGLDRDAVAEALSVDLDEARAELDQTQAHLARFGDRLPTPIREQFEALEGAPEAKFTRVSLAEETEAGSTEYRDRLLDLAQERGGDTARAFAAAYVRRLSTDGISAEHLAAEVLGAYGFAERARPRAGGGARLQPDPRRRGLRAAGLGAGDQHRRLAVPRRQRERGARARAASRSRGSCTRSSGSRARTGTIASVSHARNAVHRESVMHFDLARKLTDRELEELAARRQGGAARGPRARSPTSAR